MFRIVSSLLLATLFTLGFATTPAFAQNRQVVTSTHSPMEGCGADGLSVDAIWTPSGKNKIRLKSVFVDNTDNHMFTYVSVTNAKGVLVYAGPNGHGQVGDGKDYNFEKGFERNSEGVVVPIGASDLNPLGWKPFVSESFTVRVTSGEWRYCNATIQLNRK